MRLETQIYALKVENESIKKRHEVSINESDVDKFARERSKVKKEKEQYEKFAQFGVFPNEEDEIDETEGEGEFVDTEGGGEVNFWLTKKIRKNI